MLEYWTLEVNFHPLCAFFDRHMNQKFSVCWAGSELLKISLLSFYFSLANLHQKNLTTVMTKFTLKTVLLYIWFLIICAFPQLPIKK